jgi:hypothetical protein
METSGAMARKWFQTSGIAAEKLAGGVPVAEDSNPQLYSAPSLTRSRNRGRLFRLAGTCCGRRFGSLSPLPRFDTRRGNSEDDAVMERNVLAAEPWEAAIRSITDLLRRLKMDHAFVGSVAAAAWRGGEVASGSIDVLVLIPPERKRQIPTMAANRGFDVDRDEVEAADELDLVPLKLRHGDFLLRIHVLVASNALYAHMVTGAVPATVGELEIRVVNSEDLALLYLVADEPAAEEAVSDLIERAGEELDLDRLNRKLISIGLHRKVIQS